MLYIAFISLFVYSMTHTVNFISQGEGLIGVLKTVSSLKDTEYMITWTVFFPFQDAFTVKSLRSKSALRLRISTSHMCILNIEPGMAFKLFHLHYVELLRDKLADATFQGHTCQRLSACRCGYYGHVLWLTLTALTSLDSWLQQTAAFTIKARAHATLPRTKWQTRTVRSLAGVMVSGLWLFPDLFWRFFPCVLLPHSFCLVLFPPVLIGLPRPD